LGGCTGVEARAIGKIMAITLANSIPGHLAEPGRLSDIQELMRVQTMVIIFIWARVRMTIPYSS
jgi:hypothetical protein